MHRALIATSLLSLLPLTSCKSQTDSGTKTDTTGSSTAAGKSGDAPQDSESNWKDLESADVLVTNFKTTPAFPTEELGDPSKGHMKIDNDDQNHPLPAALAGIWWMEGNPLAPLNVTTFANAPWSGNGTTVLIQEYAPGGYSFDGNEAGMSSFTSSCYNNINFEITFNDKEHPTSGQLIQVMRVPRIGLRVKIPKWMVNYTMKPTSNGVDWLRESWWGPFRLPNYTLVRIVDGKGVKTAAFDRFKAAIDDPKNQVKTSFVPQKI